MNQKFVHHIYSLAADPEGLESFLNAMLDAYTDVLHRNAAESTSGLEGRIAASLEEVEPHVERVASIFDRFDWEDHEGDTVWEKGTSPAALNSFTTGPGNTITNVCGSKCRAFGIEQGRKLEDLPIDWDVLERFRKWFRRDTSQMRGNHVFLLPVRGSNSHPPILFSATKTLQDDRITGVSFESLELIWDPAAGAVISEVFRLTEAESEILRALVGGQSLNEIAETRRRSIQTVRTQAGSLLRKTAARSQIDLVRIFSAVAAHTRDRSVSIDHSDSMFESRTDFIEIEAGRRVQVDLCGPEDGTPVLLVHGLSTGTSFTDDVNAVLARRGLRIIAPYRPSYGGSMPVSCSFKDYPKLVANDIRRVMEHYGIERTVLLGRFTGGLFAVAAANELGDAVRGVFTVSGTPPYRNVRMLDSIQPMVRVFAYSARYFPAVIPVLVRGLLLKIFSTGEKQYFKKWYRAPDVDARCIESDELRALFARHWHASFGKTTKGYEIDASHTALDWSDWLRDLRQPLYMVHGTEDPTTVIAHMRELAADFPAIVLEEIEGGGQLLFHTHTERVVGRLADFAKARIGSPETRQKK